MSEVEGNVEIVTAYFRFLSSIVWRNEKLDILNECSILRGVRLRILIFRTNVILKLTSQIRKEHDETSIAGLKYAQTVYTMYFLVYRSEVPVPPKMPQCTSALYSIRTAIY